MAIATSLSGSSWYPNGTLSAAWGNGSLPILYRVLGLRRIQVLYSDLVGAATASTLSRMMCLAMELAPLRPYWRLVGASAVATGISVVMDVSAGTAIHNPIVAVCPLASWNSSGFVWPGVRQKPYRDQTIELQLTAQCSSLNTISSFTVDIVGSPLPSVPQSIVAVVSSTQTLSLVSAGASSASSMARVGAAISLLDCASVVQGGDATASKGLVDIAVFTGAYSDVVNAIFANVALVCSAAFLIFLLAAGISIARQRPLRDVLTELRMPSIVFPAVVATIPSSLGTVLNFAQSVQSNGIPFSASEAAIACLTVLIAAVVWLGFACWMVWISVQGRQKMVSEPKPADVSLIREGVTLRTALRFLFRSNWHWVPCQQEKPKSDSADASEVEMENIAANNGEQYDRNSGSEVLDVERFCAQHNSVFSELRVPWFTAVDIWMTVISTFISEFPIASVSGCVGCAAVNTVLLVGSFILCVWFHPSASRYGSLHIFVVQFLSLVIGVCVLAFVTTAYDGVLKVISALASGISVLSMFRSVVDLWSMGTLFLRVITRRHVKRPLVVLEPQEMTSFPILSIQSVQPIVSVEVVALSFESSSSSSSSQLFDVDPTLDVVATITAEQLQHDLQTQDYTNGMNVTTTNGRSQKSDATTTELAPDVLGALVVEGPERALHLSEQKMVDDILEPVNASHASLSYPFLFDNESTPLTTGQLSGPFSSIFDMNIGPLTLPMNAATVPSSGAMVNFPWSFDEKDEPSNEKDERNAAMPFTMLMDRLEASAPNDDESLLLHFGNGGGQTFSLLHEVVLQSLDDDVEL